MNRDLRQVKACHVDWLGRRRIVPDGLLGGIDLCFVRCGLQCRRAMFASMMQSRSGTQMMSAARDQACRLLVGGAHDMRRLLRMRDVGLRTAIGRDMCRCMQRGMQ